MQIDVKQLVSSETVRKSAIGVGVGILVLAGIGYFMIRPALAAKNNLEHKIQDTRKKLHTDRALIERQNDIRKDYAESASRLLNIINNKLAPQQNAIAWVGALFNEMADKAGLSVVELAGESVWARRTGKDTVPLFEEFAADASFQAGYHQLGRFVALLEREIPHGKLLGASFKPMRGGGQEKRRISIRFKYSFPRFTDEGFPLDQRPTPEDTVLPPEASETSSNESKPKDTAE